ncbi:hypothetical protein LB505_012616 [Fusarium chuoi]|nr:hypothetical protein LB505_012616 [Fusarium chuoi]
MTLVLYGSRQSTCTQRVLLVLSELNITDYRLSNIDMQKGEHLTSTHSDEFRFSTMMVLDFLSQGRFASTWLQSTDHIALCIDERNKTTRSWRLTSKRLALNTHTSTRQ